MTNLIGFHGGNASREGERWHPEVPTALLRINTAMGLLFSRVPPTLHFQGLSELCSNKPPRTDFGKGMPWRRQGRQSGHTAVAAARGVAGSAAGDDLPSPLTFMPISISFAAFRHLGMPAVAAAGVRGWAAVFPRENGALGRREGFYGQSWREVGWVHSAV